MAERLGQGQNQVFENELIRLAVARIKSGGLPANDMWLSDVDSFKLPEPAAMKMAYGSCLECTFPTVPEKHLSKLSGRILVSIVEQSSLGGAFGSCIEPNSLSWHKLQEI